VNFEAISNLFMNMKFLYSFWKMDVEILLSIFQNCCFNQLKIPSAESNPRILALTFLNFLLEVRIFSKRFEIS